MANESITCAYVKDKYPLFEGRDGGGAREYGRDGGRDRGRERHSVWLERIQKLGRDFSYS